MDEDDKGAEDARTRMADFEVMGRSIVRRLGRDEGEFAGLLRASLGGGPSSAVCRT